MASASTNTSSSSTVSTSDNASNSYSRSGQNANLLSRYVDEYNSAFALNNANYQNILAGYSNTLGQTQSQADRVQAGYAALNNQVQGKLGAVEAAGRQDIADQYAQATGQTQQSLVSRGLGNSTVLDSAQRGNLAQKQKADIALAGNMANLSAGYTGQFGTAGLAAQSQQQQLQGSLGNAYMGVLGGYKVPLPTWAPNETISSSASQGSSASTSQSLQQATSQQVADVLSQATPNSPLTPNQASTGGGFTAGNGQSYSNATNQTLANTFNYQNYLASHSGGGFVA